MQRRIGASISTALGHERHVDVNDAWLHQLWTDHLKKKRSFTVILTDSILHHHNGFYGTELVGFASSRFVKLFLERLDAHSIARVCYYDELVMQRLQLGRIKAKSGLIF